VGVDLVGRTDESRRLAAAADAARAGEAACWVVVGEGGVGKTRLLTEIVGHARAQGLAVLVGRAAVASPVPFGVIAEALRSWQRGQTGAAGAVEPTPFDRGLQLVLPERSGAATEHGLSDAQLRLLALEGVVELVRQIAANGSGAMVVLDDVHAADPESVEVARYLATAAVPGVALLIGMRPEESALADELLRCLAADGVAEIVDVAPLDGAAVEQLVSALAGAPAPPEFLDEIMARTDGVPLLVEEVVAAHVRAGSVSVDDGVLVWRGDAVAVPRTVREMVSARLDRLDPAHRDVLRAAAVLRDFSPDPLVAVSGVPNIDDAIDAGVRVSLLDATTDPVTFRHAIVREAVVESMGAQTRLDLHRRAAAVLAHRDAADPQALERRALHHEALDEMDEAARLFTEAAHRQARQHALLGAERLARRALDRALDPVRRVAASDALAETLVAQGRWTEALDVDLATSEVYGETPERRQRTANAYLEVGRPDAAGSIIERAYAAGDDGWQLHVAAGRAAMVVGDAERALGCAARVLHSSDADLDSRLAALDVRARAYDFLGRRADAEQTWESLAAQALLHRRTQAQLRAVVQLGKLELFANKPFRRLWEAVDLARAAGAFVELAWAEENLGIGLTLHGEMDAAQEVFDTAIARCRRLGLDQIAYLLAARGMLESLRGGDALPWLDQADAALPTPDLRLHTLSGRADIALRDGNYDEAVEQFTEAWQIMRAMPGIVPMDAPCWLVWSLAAARRSDEARRTLAEVRAIPDLDRWPSRPVVLDIVEALLDENVERVDELVTASGSLLPVDIGLIRLVGADLVTGPARVRWLREALDVYDDMGVTSTAKRIRRLLREAGEPVPRKRRTEPEVPEQLSAQGVTAREAEVLRLVSDGLSNAEIAARLVISVRTVEAHVSSLLTKLGVDRRGQLIATSRASESL
jgi:DNA-binding CsgD family transcriptional regulator/tetratricopeptide (TPR) repeat protein